MSKCVVDSSILLAVMLGEPDAARAAECLLDPVISAVNLAEVHSKVVQGGMGEEKAWTLATNLIGEAAPFDDEQARITGDLRLRTKEFGLSLGGRACLALGLVLGLPVYTTDRIWQRLKVGVKIHVIR